MFRLLSMDDAVARNPEVLADLRPVVQVECLSYSREALLEAGRWNDPLPLGLQLRGLTLGVLGVGRLGRMTARYGQAFGMRVLGCDPRPFDAPGARAVDHETLFRESDAGGNRLVQYARTHENVVITPHVGGATARTVDGARRFLARKIVHWIETGEELTAPRGTEPAVTCSRASDRRIPSQENPR